MQSKRIVLGAGGVSDGSGGRIYRIVYHGS
jgi:hypothetical protein